MTSYESVYPTSAKSSYVPGDLINIKFHVGIGKKLKKNSLRISGKVQASTAGVVLAAGTDIGLSIGAHGLIKNFIVKCSAVGELENILEYPRLVNMKYECTKVPNDLLSQSDCITELLAPDRYLYNGMLRIGSVPSTSFGSVLTAGLCWNSFSIKPVISLNTSAVDIPSNRLGYVEIQLCLSQPIDAFCGANVDGTTTFIITDLRIDYITVEDTEKDDKSPIILTGYNMDEMQLSSTNTTLVPIQPCLAQGLSITFGNIPALIQNNCLSVPLNDLQQVIWNINTVINPIEFVLDNVEDVMINYIKSMGGNLQHNNVSDTNYGIGLHFGSALDMAQNTISIQINLQNAPANPLRALVFYNKVLAI